MSEIRLQMDRGQALFLSGKYEEAADSFENSFAAYPYSAFLFNAGVSFQKAGKLEKALAAFEKYLQKDPKAPDAASVKERIEKLQVLLAPKSEVPNDTPPPPPPPTPAPPSVDEGMKSLVVIETEPSGAPVRVFARKSGSLAPFSASNPDYSLVYDGRSPSKLSLDRGHYHIEVAKFSQYNESRSNIDVLPGQVHVFKANLSQGAFLASLRVTSPVEGSEIFLDEEPGKSVLWGNAPKTDMVGPGKHKIRVRFPGYEDYLEAFEVAVGEQKEIVARLVPVSYGVLRIDSNAKEVWVKVDGKPMGIFQKGGEALTLSLPSGIHEVVVSGDGLKDLRENVEIVGGKVVPMRARMMKTYPRGVAIAQGIIALGFIGASTYFAIESDRLHNELMAERAAGVQSPNDPRINQGFWYSIGADAGFGVGGILGILSVYNFVRDPYPESELQKGQSRSFDGSEPKLASGGGK